MRFPRQRRRRESKHPPSWHWLPQRKRLEKERCPISSGGTLISCHLTYTCKISKPTLKPECLCDGQNVSLVHCYEISITLLQLTDFFGLCLLKNDKHKFWWDGAVWCDQSGRASSPNKPTRWVFEMENMDDNVQSSCGTVSTVLFNCIVKPIVWYFTSTSVLFVSWLSSLLSVQSTPRSQSHSEFTSQRRSKRNWDDRHEGRDKKRFRRKSVWDWCLHQNPKVTIFTTLRSRH